MKTTRTMLAALLLHPALLYAHEGHGMPGTVGHDLQHQLWTFVALVVMAALVLLVQRSKDQD